MQVRCIVNGPARSGHVVVVVVVVYEIQAGKIMRKVRVC